MRFRADLAVWRPLLVGQRARSGLALAINEIYFRADTLIISLYEPYDEVGLYTLAYRILEFTLVLGTIFLTTVFPLLSEAVARDEPRALRTDPDLDRRVRDPRRAAGRRRARARARDDRAGRAARTSRTRPRRCASCCAPGRCRGSTASSASR